MEKSSWQGRKCFCIIFNLSKAFDKINHAILVAKLKADGFSLNALKIINSYLNNRKQKVQTNDKFSSESTVITGVTHNFLDRPLLLPYL